MRPTVITASVAVLGLTLVVQFLLQSQFFPLALLSDGTPLLRIDSAFHQFQMIVARQLCAEGLLGGFDPTFAAGQMGGMAANGSAKLQALLACLGDGSPDSIARAYKQVSFWQGVVAPALLVLACLMLRLPPRVAALTAVLAVLSWWTGAVRWYHTAGMVSYVIVAYASIPFVIAVVQTCLQPSLLRVAGLAVLAAAGLWVHPLFPVGAALAGLVWLALEMKNRQAAVKALAVVIVVTAAMVLASMGWIAESLKAVGNPAYQQLYQRDVTPLLPLWEMLGVAKTAGGGSRLYLALVVGGMLFVVLDRRPQRRALLGLVLGTVVLLAWASVGALIPAVGSLQPNRFSAMAWLCLIVPAAAGIVAAVDRLQSGSGIAQKVWVAGPLALIAVVIAFFMREAGREIFAGPEVGRYGVAPPEIKGQGAMSTELVKFLRERTDRSARVLFEVSLARVHDGAHMAGLYALAADREFIGGPYPYTDYASAWDNVAFGKPYAEHDANSLLKMLDAYNVRWMLCHSESCRAAMSALSGVTAMAVIGPVTAYGRVFSSGFIAQGQAHIKARCINRLELQGANGTPLVLRYHWVPGLVTVPAARVEPVNLVPGARPFISILDPPAEFILRVGEGNGVPCDKRPGFPR